MILHPRAAGSLDKPIGWRRSCVCLCLPVWPCKLAESIVFARCQSKEAVLLSRRFGRPGDRGGRRANCVARSPLQGEFVLPSELHHGHHAACTQSDFHLWPPLARTLSGLHATSDRRRRGGGRAIKFQRKSSSRKETSRTAAETSEDPSTSPGEGAKGQVENRMHHLQKEEEEM